MQIRCFMWFFLNVNEKIPLDHQFNQYRKLNYKVVYSGIFTSSFVLIYVQYNYRLRSQKRPHNLGKELVTVFPCSTISLT